MLLGLLAGVWAGLKGLASGVELAKPKAGTGSGGYLIPALFLLLLVFFLVRPGFLLFSSQGQRRATCPLADCAVSGYRTWRLGATQPFLHYRQHPGYPPDGFQNIRAVGACWPLSVASLCSALCPAGFNPGLYGQPGAHLDYLWSFLGMGLVGWISVIIGGCPFRQLIKAGEGDADAGLVVIGMFIGGALAQSWGIAATAAGVSLYGKISILSGFVLIAMGSLLFRERSA